jgi:hypothetical protein
MLSDLGNMVTATVPLDICRFPVPQYYKNILPVLYYHFLEQKSWASGLG